MMIDLRWVKKRTYNSNGEPRSIEWSLEYRQKLEEDGEVKWSDWAEVPKVEDENE